jgi:alpha-beta hydrolase superfamily lysophospholipase
VGTEGNAFEGTPADGSGATQWSVLDPDGVSIVCYSWEVPSPRAIVHIAHGVGEHALRYAHVARALNTAGYSVVGDDHRGHGATGQGHLGLGVLGRGANRPVFAAVEAVSREVRAQHPGVPLVLLGHSWGSLIGQKIVARDPALYDGVVLSGTSLAVPGVINAGDLNKRWRGPTSTGFEWLSRDEAVARDFAADPLTFDVNEVHPYTKLQALQLLGRPPRHLPPDLPILVQGGSEDSLGGVRGMTRLADSYRRRSGLWDVSLMIYPGARHEIYNETVKDDVLADLVAWLDARFPAPEPSDVQGEG